MPTAFAEIAVGLPRNSCLDLGHRLNGHSRLPQQFIIAAARHRIAAAVDDGGPFNVIDRRNTSMTGPD